MGMDNDGRLIRHEYSLTREYRGGGRVREPGETIYCDVRDLKIDTSGEVVYDLSGRMENVREPTTKELAIILQQTNLHTTKVTDLWLQKQPTGEGPSNERKRAETHPLHEAESGEQPPVIPYCPPGHVLCPIVSFILCLYEYTYNICHHFQPSDFGGLRLGDMFAVDHEMQGRIEEALRREGMAKTVQDLEPHQYYHPDSGAPVRNHRPRFCGQNRRLMIVNFSRSSFGAKSTEKNP